MPAVENQLPPARYADVNGVRMAYYEVGPREGVPVILCHGFPELAFSWRHQLKALEAAGRWAIAPDQRGYGLTSCPAAVTDYDIDHLTGDLIGLLDHLGVEKAIFCGHDWGGLVVWRLVLMHPDRCAGVIGLNTPFMQPSPVEPIALMRMAMGEDMYVVWFQKPAEADAALAEDVEKTMRFFMRRPDPAAQAGERPNFAFGQALKAWDKSDETRELLDPAELAFFVEAFQRTGFTGAINWYRNVTRNWEISGDLPTRIDDRPCLMVMAENDVVLSPAMADSMEDFIEDLEKVLLKGCGHWTQQEKPEEVNRIILDWLNRRFPQ
jgi:pimeloyl-ACP methyl ester carboxylesterase